VYSSSPSNRPCLHYLTNSFKFFSQLTKEVVPTAALPMLGSVQSVSTSVQEGIGVVETGEQGCGTFVEIQFEDCSTGVTRMVVFIVRYHEITPH
jgi:hypothetical protein